MRQLRTTDKKSKEKRVSLKLNKKRIYYLNKKKWKSEKSIQDSFVCECFDCESACEIVSL